MTESPSPTSEFEPRGSKSEIEEGTRLSPKFDANGLLPAVATDHATGEVLMLAWMNAEALRQTIERGEAVYYSRSRGELWHKGATSGHVQTVHEIRVDCDQDTVWLRVTQHGAGACHVGFRSCFYRRIDGQSGLVFVDAEKSYDPDDVYSS